MLCLKQFTHKFGLDYKGEYGWRNGEFRNRLPSWEPFTKYEVYFRGESIAFPEGTLAKIKTLDLRVIVIEDHFYIIRNEISNYGHHYYHIGTRRTA